MAIRYEDYLAKLPEDEIKAIDARAAELIKEEASLRALRKRLRKQREFGQGDKISDNEGPN